MTDQTTKDQHRKFTNQPLTPEQEALKRDLLDSAPMMTGSSYLAVENTRLKADLTALRASLQQVVEEMRTITELGSVANRTLVRQWIAALSPLSDDTNG